MRSKDPDKMNRILEYIDDTYFTTNSVPTMQEIADYMGMTKSNVSGYIKEMSEKGMISTSGGWRGLSTNKMQKTLSNLTRVPILGSIACGTPMFAEENIESYVTISSSFLGSGNYFLLRASGESMINAGIEDGDLVLVKQQNTAEEGQIVVALVEDSTTLKRLYIDRNKKKIRLHPENDNMEDMYFDSVEIQGVVKKVLKDVY